MANFVGVEQGGGICGLDNSMLSEKIFQSNPKGASGAGEFSTVGTAVECAAEAAVLKDYGINLKPNHFEGYQSKSEDPNLDKSAIVKPWETPILEQFGPTKAIKCETLEGWNNEDFLFEVREGIAYCTLNRPAANNALNDTISAGFHDSARILRNRPDIRIVVLTGNGRMFCAGGDPKAFQQGQAAQEDQGPAEGPPVGAEIIKSVDDYSGQFVRKGLDLMSRDLYEWATLPQFTLCCMNGSAMGHGIGFVSVCNMVVAVRTAHATLSEAKLGVVPATVAPYVINTIGMSNAIRLFATAENATMQTAIEMGLVQRIVNDVNDFPVVIKEVTAKIQACAPNAIAAGKQVILNCLHQPMSENMMQYISGDYARVRKAQECEEAMKSLGSKKKPSWVANLIALKD
jgi:methylglutaconyl-CoA hydratase